MKRKRLAALFVSIIFLLLGSPDTSFADANTAANGFLEADAAATLARGTLNRPEGWTAETRSNQADPNYEVVFPRDRVNQIKITISPANWEAMQADLAALLGPGEMGQREVGHRNPIWIPATIEFKGNMWTNVGVRYKGDLTLKEAWSGGSLKLPLKLDFDQFEDQFPEVRDQRFYGFKQLSLANGLHDDSFLRDTLTYDLLEEAGLVASRTAFYDVIVDHGEGPVGLGLYTMIEVIDDTVVKRHFWDDNGNIYEADGPAASLAEGTFQQIEESFQKKNNEKKADWSDVEALYGVLHSEEATTDPESWRANLESVFDVDVFLKWLAIGAVIDHWDTYGAQSHNYYLYDDPRTGLLTWISWDHNLVLGDGYTSVDKEDIGADWPLIRYLLDDPVYYVAYVNRLAETVNGLFDPDRMEAKYQQMASMLEPYAARESRPEPFQTAVEVLFQTARDRAKLVKDFLATHGWGNRWQQ